MSICLLVSRNALVVGLLYYNIIAVVFVVRQTTQLRWDSDERVKLCTNSGEPCPANGTAGKWKSETADAISPARCSTSATNKLPGLGARNERKALLNHRSCE